MNNIIEIMDLEKNYGEIKAVQSVTFHVKQGELFAFLGPNGAGKSTTINIICTLLQKTKGEVIINGMRLGVEDAKIRSHLGVVFQNNVMDDLLSVKENLYCRGGLYGRTNQELDQHIRTISDVMKIDDILHRPFGRLSGGQKRRAEIARALMSEAKILILDEPTTGLDPQTRIHVWEIIARLRAEFNMTVFLTTHYMEEAATADMVSVIDYGRIVAQGTPSQLKAKFSSDILKVALKNPKLGTEKLMDMNMPAIVQNGIHHIRVVDSLEAYRVLKILEDNFDSFEVIHGNMDDVFVNITGHGIREAL